MVRFANLRDSSFIGQDVLASFVVFLVALPLSMGVAVASGLSPIHGLVTGIIGGILVGTISGSPLQVSGPAAGLVVTVAEVIRQNGVEMLGSILLLAGLIQLLAGVLKIGKIFRMISPAVIYGMLSGIGILIFASQFHVMLQQKPQETGMENLLTMPASVINTLVASDSAIHLLSTAIGLTTLLTFFLWERFKPLCLRLLPGSLVSVVLATAIAQFLQLPIAFVSAPTDLAAVIQLPALNQLIHLADPTVWIAALTIAFVASAESLLSAAALDKLHQGTKTNFNRELAAQGFGNMVCGGLGVLPITGVIVRSAVNVKSGAKTRLSAILHGVWILALIMAIPDLLGMIPLASLAAILMIAGSKLIEIKPIQTLQQYGRMPLVIFSSTLVGIVMIDLLVGVVIGVVLTVITLVVKVSHLNISVQQDESNRRLDIDLEGSATFILLPKLAAALEVMPNSMHLYVHLERLAYIDHSCFDWLQAWAKQQEQKGNTVMIPWSYLEERFQSPFLSF
jgi:MFS superfamily sulfate permease-like transporter